MPNYLTVHEKPEAQIEYLLTAFGGWADAAESATTTLKYLQRRLQARKFAEIDPEEFFDFTHTRPSALRTKEGSRRIQWPANEFAYSVGSDQTKGIMFFLGVEPNLRWRTFSRTIAELAQECGVKTVVHVGALLDAVPHTREVSLTGTATNPDLRRIMEGSSIRASNYQGPTGISSAVLEACANQGMGCASLWGHTAHYLQAAPNYRVSYTLAEMLNKLLGLSLDLGELSTAARTFDEEVAEAVTRDEQLSSYVKKLEDQYDESTAAGEMPDPAEVVKDLERFLRSERRQPGDQQF